VTGRPRVVVAGLGDTGVLSAIHLSRHADVVGISAKPEMVSGQELGLRLTRPATWAREYRVAFHRYRGLDRVRVVHGLVTGLDPDARQVQVRTADGTTSIETYDVLVVATGVTNGFWRRPDLQSSEDVDAALARAHDRLATAGSVAVVGGGAAAVGSATNLATVWPDKQVDLYFPGERPLPRHHPRVWRRLEQRLAGLGVGLHPGHRAELPADAVPELAPGPVRWTTGQPPTDADAVLWAVGRVEPNTSWLPAELLDAGGFVRVGPDLRVPGVDGVFAVGDVAATDPLRTSARNAGHLVLAHNVRAHLRGGRMRSYRPPRRRWGSVIGPQADGLIVFAPDGRGYRVPALVDRYLVRAVVVAWGIYRGIRRPG
jgi:NADH dehydrogenase FAD-containing subunit